MKIHPKVGWSAFVMSVTTAVMSIVAAYGWAFPPAAAAGVTAIIGALVGYSVPDGPVA